MKNVVFFLFLSFIMVGCGLSKEEKATLFAENEVKKILNDASSYEAVETRVDSAFVSIYTDYEACEAAYNISELYSELEFLQNDYYNEKSDAAIWTGAWDSYGKEQYQQAKNKMGEIEKKLKKVDDEITENKEVIKNRYESIDEGEFCGWAVYHRFRCANGLGVKSLVDVLLITDEDIETLKIRMLLDDNAPQGFKQIKQIIDDVLEE